MHEEHVSERLGGSRHKGSGNQWNSPGDGSASAMKHPYGFNVECKATSGKAVPMTRELVEKITEEASGGDRPAMAFRWYADESLRTVDHEWFALSFEDFLEILHDAGQAQLLAGQVTAMQGELQALRAGQESSRAQSAREVITSLQSDLRDRTAEVQDLRRLAGEHQCPPAEQEYPRHEGDITVLGPEIFADAAGGVIAWKGENYTRQAAPAPPSVPGDGTRLLLDEIRALQERGDAYASQIIALEEQLSALVLRAAVAERGPAAPQSVAAPSSALLEMREVFEPPAQSRPWTVIDLRNGVHAAEHVLRAWHVDARGEVSRLEARTVRIDSVSGGSRLMLNDEIVHRGTLFVNGRVYYPVPA
jgi:hypothetical protein